MNAPAAVLAGLLLLVVLADTRRDGADRADTLVASLPWAWPFVGPEPRPTPWWEATDAEEAPVARSARCAVHGTPVLVVDVETTVGPVAYVVCLDCDRGRCEACGGPELTGRLGAACPGCGSRR